MPQSGYTPILIYASATPNAVPSAANLISTPEGAELALNYYDGKLYYKDSSGTVQQLTGGGGGGGVTTFSAGITGLYPSAATTGAITLSGILNTSSGGTGQTNLTSGAILLGNGTSSINFLTGGANNGYVATWNSSTSSWYAAPVGVSAGVSSFNARVGAVVPQSYDYSSYYYPLTGNPSNFITSSALSGYASLTTGSKQTFTGGLSVPSGVDLGTGGMSLFGGALNFSQYTSIFYSANEMQFAVSTSGFNDVLILGNTAIYAVQQLVPYNDNSVACGGAANRWTQIWAVSNTINTSDENEKTEISNLDEVEKRVATRIKGLVKKYKWKDSVAKKGDDNARIHVGFIAQDIRDAFVAEGLDPTRYGMFCSDDIPAEEAVYYPDGTLKKAAVTACTRLGVRYDQVISFVISAL
jgi:hypothetical protein